MKFVDFKDRITVNGNIYLVNWTGKGPIRKRLLAKTMDRVYVWVMIEEG